MKTLVIAEKPSVASDIVKALTPLAGKFEKQDEYFESENYVITSAVGHLLEIQAPEEFDVKRGKWSFANLPVIPPHFDLKPMDKVGVCTRPTVVKKKPPSRELNAVMARVPLMPTNQSASERQRAASASGSICLSVRKLAKPSRMACGVMDCSHRRDTGCLALLYC